MKLGNVSLLSVALATAFAATACNRTDDTASTYDDKPATTADQPAAETTTPAAAPAATNTASTETEPATDAVPATTTAPATATTAPAMEPGATLADATTLFDDMDVNKDNGLSQDELPDTHPLRQGFTIADSDGNGMLSRTEVDSYRSKMPPPGG